MKKKSLIISFIILIFLFQYFPLPTVGDIENETPFVIEKQLKFNSINDMKYSPSGNYLAISVNNYIEIFNITSQEIEKRLVGSTEKLTSIDWRRDEKNIVGMSDNDYKIFIWNVANCTLIQELDGHSSEEKDDAWYEYPFQTFVKYSPDGKKIVSSSASARSGTTRIWESNQNTINYYNTITLDQTIRGGAVFNNNNLIISGDNKVYIIDFINGSILMQINVIKNNPDGIISPQFINNDFSNELITIGNDKVLEWYDLDSSLLTKSFSEHSGSIRAFDMHNYLDYFISGGTDKRIFLWSKNDIKLISILYQGDSNVRFLFFHPIDAYFISGFDNGLILFWKENKNINNKIPSVKIISPTQNEIISEFSTFYGLSEDDNSVEFVEIKIDNSEWIRTMGTENWYYYFNPEIVRGGEHTLSARAFDGVLYSEIVKILFIINNSNSQALNDFNIEIDIGTPRNNEIYSGEVDVQIFIKIICFNNSIYNPKRDKYSIKILLSIDGNYWEETFPFRHGWAYLYWINSSYYPNGLHQIAVKGVYNNFSSGYNSVNIFFDNTHSENNEKPIINILEPKNDETIINETIIKGEHFDDIGVNRIDIKIGNDTDWRVVSNFTSNNWTFTFLSNNYQNGHVIIYARAFDGEYFSDTSVVMLFINNTIEPNPSPPLENDTYLSSSNIISILIIVLLLLFGLLYFILRKKDFSR